jgi:hypothetical protein
MQFNSADVIESVCWYMRLTDFPRATNRALVDKLFNGFTPFTPAEQAENKINTNVNFLDSTRIAHDMRRQFNNGFLRPGNAFRVRCNFGPSHKRSEYSAVITEEINRQIKTGKSALAYRECLRNVFAQVTLHGIGPRVWPDKQMWCPSMQMMGDVLIPSGTLLTMENLTHFAIQRRYTAATLYKLTNGPKVDPGWKKETVDSCIKWALQQQTQSGQGDTEDMYLSPERLQEAFKADLGYFSTDRIPVIKAWDFYFLNETSKNYGWQRKVVLDSPDPKSGKNFLGQSNQFLYDGGKRIYAENLQEIIHFQYADGSVVAPFQYHSVRSLGFLLYAVCHLQNRLRCKFSDSVFESLLNYFRVSNPADAERLQKVDLVNLGIIPEGLSFVPRSDRWNVDPNLIQAAFALNRQTMADNSSKFTSDFGIEEEGDKTATQINAEVSASTALTSSMLQEAYGYEEFAHREICRRFCIPNSRDYSVREFRKSCLQRGIPEEAIDVRHWDVNVERVIGAGNKQMELNIVNQLMGVYTLLEPESQRKVLRLKVFADTDDAALTNDLVPDKPKELNSTIHDAQMSSGTLLMGIPMTFMEGGINHGEYATVLIGVANTELEKIKANGNMADMPTINGLQNLLGQTADGQPIPGNGAMAHIQVYAQDPQTKETVKVLTDIVGKQMNEIRALIQRLEEAQGQAGAEGGQPPLTPEDAVKLKSELAKQEMKSAAMAEAHKQRSDQRAEIHEQKMREKREDNMLKNASTIRGVEVDETVAAAETAAEIERQNAKAAAEIANRQAQPSNAD